MTREPQQAQAFHHCHYCHQSRFKEVREGKRGCAEGFEESGGEPGDGGDTGISPPRYFSHLAKRARPKQALPWVVAAGQPCGALMLSVAGRVLAVDGNVIRYVNGLAFRRSFGSGASVPVWTFGRADAIHLRR
jgi:hypothetical protein